MSVFITSIAELSQNFFNSDPLKFNQYFAITPDYQKYCLSTNLLTRSTLTLAKEAMLIHDIAIHLLAGGCKLTTGTVKGICAIASGILGLETDHQTPSKQAAVHFGFACVYAADIFVSITNINNTYPQHLIDKIKNVFINFLEVPNKEITIEYFVDPNLEEQLRAAQEELEETNTNWDQLARDIETVSTSSKQPSQCEKIVDEILNPDKSIILAKVRSITKNNQKQLEEEIENTFKKAETKEKDSSSLPNNQLSYNSSQFRLTDIEIKSNDAWYDGSFDLFDSFNKDSLLISCKNRNLKEDEMKKNSSIDHVLTTSNQSENLKKKVQSDLPPISKSSNKKTSPKGPLKKDPRTLSLEYSKKQQTQFKKTRSRLVNFQ